MKRTRVIAVLIAVFLLVGSGLTLSAAQETIRITSWNIKNFGASKAKDPDKMRAIEGILKEYDLIAVQERVTD